MGEVGVGAEVRPRPGGAGDPFLDEGQAGHVRQHQLQLVRTGDPVEAHSLALHLR